MTRETKIGLLVGLAFIIVIGILLSDHVKSTTEPLPAPLPQAAENVRDSVRAPGADESSGYSRDTIVTPAQPIAPRQPVPTPGELSPRPPEVVVNVGGPNAPQPPVVIRQNAHSPVKLAPGSSNDANRDAALTADASPQTTPPAAPDALTSAAQSHGEALVPVGSREDSAGAAPRKYTAQAGDTLSHLAARFMGGNTKANRDAIVKANPSLQQDPDKIVVGHAYVIPTGIATGVAAAPAPTPSTPAAATAADAPTGASYWYTVQANDSLWSIAADQLGNGAAWTAIKELNNDLLKGGDTVHPNMRLRLPAKPVVSASAR